MVLFKIHQKNVYYQLLLPARRELVLPINRGCLKSQLCYSFYVPLCAFPACAAASADRSVSLSRCAGQVV